MASQEDPDAVQVSVAPEGAPAQGAPDGPAAEGSRDRAAREARDAEGGSQKPAGDPGSPADAMAAQLEAASRRADEYEEKLKHAMADFRNLERKTRSDIESGVNAGIDGFMLDFLVIYDELTLARRALSGSGAEGLDSILRSMGQLLEKRGVKEIGALGEIFDPNLHEAISVATDPELDENTVTKEIRKGYISHGRVIRPTLVEISKKE